MTTSSLFQPCVFSGHSLNLLLIHSSQLQLTFPVCCNSCSPSVCSLLSAGSVIKCLSFCRACVGRVSVSTAAAAAGRNPVQRSQRSGLDQICNPLKLTSPNSFAVRKPAVVLLSLREHQHSQKWSHPAGQQQPGSVTPVWVCVYVWTGCCTLESNHDVWLQMEISPFEAAENAAQRDFVPGWFWQQGSWTGSSWPSEKFGLWAGSRVPVRV